MHRLLLAVASALVLPSLLSAAEPEGPLPCEGGKAGPYPCRAVEQASFLSLDDLSNEANDVAGDVVGWHHEPSGREFAFLSLGDKTVIVEVTDPESPQVIGDYARDVHGLGAKAIFEDHLYGLVGTQLLIFDLTRLLTASGPPVSFAPDATVALPFFPSGLAINQETGFAYAFGLRIVALDLNVDPESPQQVMDWNPTSPHPRSLECVIFHGPDQRFAGHEICFGGAGNTFLVIYDVTDKAHPVRLSSTKYKHSNTPRDTAITTDHRVLLLADSHDENLPGGNTRTFLWDLSSLTRPVYFKSYDGTTHARDLQLEVRGRYAYLANATAGLRILDLAQIGGKKSRVREVGYFDLEPGLSNTSWFGAYSLAVFPSGTVVVSGLRQGLFVLVPQL